MGWASAAARHFEPAARRWATPGELARSINPRTIQTPALELIDQELVRLADEPDGRLIISMPPQEGKSVRVAGDFPVWWLTMFPDARIVTASYGQDLATRNGRSIRRRITTHPQLGLRIAADNGAVHEWTLDGHDGGVLSVGVGGGLTGRPADLLIIDDPIKNRKEADSETYREDLWDWWTDVAASRLAPGAPVVVILTRWHEDDLAGKLLDPENEDHASWRVLNIPAQAEHKPEEGEEDVLGREPGEFMVSARGRTQEGWERRKRMAGPRTWAALYQGHPAPAGGDIFKDEWWQTYDTPLHLVRADGSHFIPAAGHEIEMCQSWDMAFKDTESSDWVVGQVWLRRGVDAFLLDQVRGRWDFVTTCRKIRELSAVWPQAIAKLVEDKANGTAVMNSLRRQLAGLTPVEPVGGKEARAIAVTPVVASQNVWLPAPELAPWIGGLKDELGAFPTGKHDDQVDALTTQGLHHILLVPILDGRIMGASEVLGEEDEADDFSYASSY
jgi:predicted phage terminase large subunit-like protein